MLSVRILDKHPAPLFTIELSITLKNSGVGICDPLVPSPNPESHL